MNIILLQNENILVVRDLYVINIIIEYLKFTIFTEQSGNLS